MALVTLVAGLHGCGEDEGRCGALTRLCADDGAWLAIAARVDDAVRVDLDGDGQDETVLLDRAGQQLAVAHADDRRSMVFLADEGPQAIAALSREVAVALTNPSALAFFGVDAHGQLERRRDIALARDPTAIRGVDLDGDGTPELVAAVPPDLLVIDPASGAQREFPAGAYPRQFDVGDVDGDGRLDVVVMDAGGALQVMRGTGDGGLREPEASPAVVRMNWLDLADYDGDGDLDVFTRDENRVLVHRNSGSGEFASPMALPFTAPIEGSGLAAGPIADGGLVGVTVPFVSGLTTWFGKGAVWLGSSDEALLSAGTWVGAGTDGGFLAGATAEVRQYTYLAGGSPIEVWRSESIHGSLTETALVTGHLDDDHLLDVVAVADGQMMMLRGRADRGLEPVDARSVDAAPVAMAIADVTGDGLADILASDAASVWLLRAIEDMGYALPSPHATQVAPYDLVPLRSGPGEPAAVMVVSVNDSMIGPEVGVRVLRFDSDGAVAEEEVVSDGPIVLGASAVDFDEDGVDEPLIFGRDGDTVFLAHMVPDGPGYAVATQLDLTAATGLPADAFSVAGVPSGDLDGDGQLEVVVGLNGEIVTVSGLAAGAPVVAVVPGIVIPKHLRDVDGDGLLDAVSAVNYWQFWHHRGRGDGTFDPTLFHHDFVEGTAAAFASVPDAQFDMVHISRSAIATHLLRPVVRPVMAGDIWFHGHVERLVVADVDGDGHDDVVTRARDVMGDVGVLWGGEDDALARGTAHNFASTRAFAAGDLDGDGDSDLVVVEAPGTLKVLLSQPHRRLEPMSVPDLVFGRPTDVVVADVDADGLADVVTFESNEGLAVIKVARGVASLKFAAPVAVADVAAGIRSSLELGDVDGDGDLDMLVRSNDAGDSSIVLADAPGDWGVPAVLPGFAATFSPINSAGRVDLFTQEGGAVYRHSAGAADQRTRVVQLGDEEWPWMQRVADIDGDGDHDVVATDGEGTHVWLRGDDGVRRVDLSETSLGSIEVADVDGDGRRDLVGIYSGVMFVRRTGP